MFKKNPNKQTKRKKAEGGINKRSFGFGWQKFGKWGDNEPIQSGWKWKTGYSWSYLAARMSAKCAPEQMQDICHSVLHVQAHKSCQHQQMCSCQTLDRVHVKYENYVRKMAIINSGCLNDCQEVRLFNWMIYYFPDEYVGLIWELRLPEYKQERGFKLYSPSSLKSLICHLFLQSFHLFSVRLSSLLVSVCLSGANQRWSWSHAGIHMEIFPAWLKRKKEKS